MEKLLHEKLAMGVNMGMQNFSHLLQGEHF